MKNKILFRQFLIVKIIFLIFFTSISNFTFAQTKYNEVKEKLRKYVKEKMVEADIPGISCVIITDSVVYTDFFGYADLEKKSKVNSKTLFELGSCTKAFTSLALLKLEEQKKVDLDSSVSSVIPWLYFKYKGKPVTVTLWQLLHHTSGLPWHTISKIPECKDENALEQTVKKIVGIELGSKPGAKYEYATINYDILALVLETVSKSKFENYMRNEIFNPLQLYNTSIGLPVSNSDMATGYKIGFFKPRKYNAPIYRGNYAAGYCISNADDLTKWLKFQMGFETSDLSRLAQKTHLRDESVAPVGLLSYALGWQISLSGNGEISHSGLNPNFSSYIGFRPKEKIGIVLLTNSNSSYTPILGSQMLAMLTGEKIDNTINPNNSLDKAFSIVSIVIFIYIVLILIFFIKILYDISKRKRTYDRLTLKKVFKIISLAILIIPFLFGIYLLPKALANFNWETAIVWTPISFISMIVLILSATILSFKIYIISILFPEKNKFKRVAPQIVLVSILSGISNMAIILLITSSLRGIMSAKYLAFFYVLTLAVYIAGRKYVQTNLIKFTRDLIYDLKMNLIEKIFSTSYQKFERMDRGRVYATLNDDIGTVGQSANMIIMLVSSFITVGGAFVYLASIAFWTTVLTVFLVITISSIYYVVSRKTQIYFEEARDTRNVFMRLLNGMIDGYKEISLHLEKKLQFKDDIAYSANGYREKISTAQIKFVNAFLIGESLLIVILGAVTFAVPKIFPGIQLYTVMSFIIILLYLIGPLNAILSSVPMIMQLKVAWNRIKAFQNDIPATLDLRKTPKIIKSDLIKSLKMTGVTYKYENVNDQEGFSVGPIDLEINKGEILFMIGGNGSGKTTLAKLLTGLYTPHEGELLINDTKVEPNEIGEYFSTVFNPFYLFQKLYNIDLTDKSIELKEYLRILQLEDKITINNNEFSTIDLSGGQRKRLALLECYLQDKPIYLFDEWAADQDPEFRKFFYRELLTKMKNQGKIIIAITHDDHYFDVADKILKLDFGKVEFIKSSKEVSAPILM